MSAKGRHFIDKATVYRDANMDPDASRAGISLWAPLHALHNAYESTFLPRVSHQLFLNLSV